MKYHEAKETFQFALGNQKTISIKKLKVLMQSMNISLEPSKSVEIKYLKGEISKLRKENKRLVKKLNKQKKKGE